MAVHWVRCKLGLDEETNEVKLSCDNKDDFVFATGLLLRVSLETTKEILIDGSKNGVNQAEKEEESNGN